jgi:Holliday junction resolvase RusA-like endonuclease
MIEMQPVERFPPDGASLVCEFVVIGHPMTAGSKRAFIPRRGDGSMVTRPDGAPMVVTNDDTGAKGAAWRQDVAAAGLMAVDAELLSTEAGPRVGFGPDAPLALDILFVLARPKGHYRTGRNAHLLRDSAPSRPGTKPDALKLARAVEDALTSVIWRDDSLVVDGRQRKVFGSPERAEVRVWRLPATVAELPVPGQAALPAAA